MRSLSSLFRVVTQGALALLPHSSPSAGQQQQQQYLRGIAPAAALHSSSIVDTHAAAPFPRRAAAAADGESIKLGGGDLSWTADGKKIKVNGKPFHLKGVSWFGFELQEGMLMGLGQRSLDEMLQFLVDNNFNALRLPFSTKWALDYDRPVYGNFKDGDLNGMTRRGILNKVIERAGDFNILVMLDSHRLNDQEIPPLWYNDEFPEEKMLEAWDAVLGDTKHHWNLFAVDIKNEPHASATWGAGKPETDWNTAAERIGKHLLTKHPEFTGLVFVEGLNYSIDFPVEKHPIDLGSPAFNKRLVYSPHQYGPSVTGDAHFAGGTYMGFPENQVSEWERCWGRVQDITGQAVVIGEWGGKADSYSNARDTEWQTYFSKYLIQHCFSDQFVWDLNPESGDTGGLLKSDWWTPEALKLQLYDTVQPHPSWLSKGEDGAFYLQPGQYANPKCAQK